MKHLDLFSGIGGFALAASWVWGPEHKIVGFCEIDKFCQQVLNKHWPDVPIYDDVKEIYGIPENTNSLRRRWGCKDSRQVLEVGCSKTETSGPSGETGNPPGCFTKGSIDIITGGFPCQPFSQAGKRRGKEDDRHLWPEYLRIIQEVRPRWVLGENVVGIINMELDQVLLDLEGEGYSCQSVVIPACAVNAVHRRDRVWIIAHSNDTRAGQQLRADNGKKRNLRGKETSNIFEGCNELVDTYSESPKLKFTRTTRSGGDGFTNKHWCDSWVEVATRLCRVDDGVSKRVDRLKALGNSIVPQVAYEILKAIKECDED